MYIALFSQRKANIRSLPSVGNSGIFRSSSPMHDFVLDMGIVRSVGATDVVVPPPRERAVDNPV
ncbi:hypothetical protein DPMN_059108 [Dreissena polymorpha]|uniref:Uncharacterized protein n=1 Tax=Dreissena polymorpha TaxID=45954 RepID=A0A9D4C3C4_DREPO|nr:hypothetical protein DPMN_059108 [Dreissena polymorpha]